MTAWTWLLWTDLKGVVQFRIPILYTLLENSELITGVPVHLSHLEDPSRQPIDDNEYCVILFFTCGGAAGKISTYWQVSITGGPSRGKLCHLLIAKGPFLLVGIFYSREPL